MKKLQKPVGDAIMQEAQPSGHVPNLITNAHQLESDNQDLDRN